MHPTIKDVAKLAGVSFATVSRVINNRGYVREEVKRRVLNAVAELHYERNAIALSMVKKVTHSIGLLIPDISNPIFTAMARGVEDAGHRLGYQVVLCNTDDNVEKEMGYVKMLHERRSDGLVVATAGGSTKHLKVLKESGVPLILMDRDAQGIDVTTVVADNVDGAYRLMSHMLQLGHRRLGVISGVACLSPGRDRFEGCMKALREHDISMDDTLVVSGQFRKQGGYEAALKMLDAEPRPEAVVSLNCQMTLGALAAFKERGVRVPGDVAFAAFDDMELCPFTDPPLTVVSQPAYSVGTTAAQHLVAQIEGQRTEEGRIILQTQLIVRESCGFQRRKQSQRNVVTEPPLSNSDNVPARTIERRSVPGLTKMATQSRNCLIGSTIS